MSALKQEVQQLVTGYFNWLKDETRLKTFKNHDETIAITTPHLDRHNDFLEIVVERTEGGFELSDDGYILSDLANSGCNINTPKRKTILNEILNGFGVTELHKQLIVEANEDNFAEKKHALVQAMLAVNDMFFIAAPHVRNFFIEDVRHWIEQSRIPAIEGAGFTGKSGFNHKFSFTVPPFGDKGERYINAVNNPDRQAVQNIVMAWEDIKPIRPDNAQAYAILNDARPIKSNVKTALSEYSIRPVPWSERQTVVEELSLA